MFIETLSAMTDGRDSREAAYHVVRWTAAGTIADIVDEVKDKQLQSLVFFDEEFFATPADTIAMCREMRVFGINVLWSARLTNRPTRAMLKEMRLAGCQRLDMIITPDGTTEGLDMAREFGFDVRLRNADGSPDTAGPTHYTVAERRAVAERLPGLHAAQFDLAVALYRARRFREVMLPLGKAMTLRYPMNELCLNLLACLSAAKHYPDMASGLLDQAGHGWPHPVVLRNRKLLRSWLESGGDLRGVRLMLEPATGCRTMP